MVTSLRSPASKAGQLIWLLQLLDTDSNMSENPTEQVKDTVYAAASMPGEWVQQNVVNPIQSYTAGEKTEEPGGFYVPVGS